MVYKPKESVDAAIAQAEVDGNWDGREALFLSAANSNSRNADVYYALGQVYMGRSDWNLAASYLTQALSLSPYHRQAGALYAATMWNLRRLEEAEEAYEKAIIAEPGNEQLVESLAVVRRAILQQDGGEEGLRAYLRTDGSPQAMQALRFMDKFKFSFQPDIWSFYPPGNTQREVVCKGKAIWLLISYCRYAF